VDIRHLEALRAVAEEGSFTAAADRLHTVQSNVSEQVRQLEAELGVQLIVRDRRGAVPTEFGIRVLDRARAIRSEIDALRLDLSMLQGLDVGHATLGVVGTISSWLVPQLVAQLADVAPGVSLRLTEGASERLAAEVVQRELAAAIVTEPVHDPRLVFEHLRDEALVGLIPTSVELGVAEPIPLAALAGQRLILPPTGNPLRDEIDDAATREGVTLRVPIEVEGIRLIGDLVAAGAGLSIVPSSAIPALRGVRRVMIARMPPRRLAYVYPRAAQLTLADQAVREVVARLVRTHE
jgi:DNA-binding transcriptional LysR family regulator